MPFVPTLLPTWILAILRPWAILTVNRVPVTTYSILEIDPATLTLTDDPINLRQILSVSGSGLVTASRTLTAGAGMTGGGDLTADRTFNVRPNLDGSIVVNADDVQVGVLATDAQHGNLGNGPLHSVATTSAAGFMSASDKTKLNTVTAGAAVADVTGTAPIVSSGGLTPAISIVAATTSVPGSMSAADKTKLDGITAGAAVASVSGTAPIASTGGTTPAISISAATTAAAGSMSAADKVRIDSITSPYSYIAPIVLGSGGGGSILLNRTGHTVTFAGCSFQPQGSVGADMSDYVTVQLIKADPGSPGGATVIASIDTTVDAWTAFTEVEITVTPFSIGHGYQLGIAIVPSGAGVEVPALYATAWID